MSLYLYSHYQKNNAQQYNQKSFSDYQKIYASGEILADIAYEFENMIGVETHKLLDEDGQWKDYQIYPLNIKAEGLKPYVLIPVEKTNKEIKLVFRGTADLPSLWRDLEIGAPGAQSFEQHKDSIYHALLDIMQAHYEPTDKVSLTIAGHSLGASDAENFATYVCEVIAKQENTNPFSGLNVFSLNSPGITHEATQSSVNSVRLIKNNHPDFKIQVHYGKTEHDLIQQLGQNHFLNGVDPKLAEIDLIELKKKYDFSAQFPAVGDMESAKFFLASVIQQYLGRTIDAHKLKSYFSPDENGVLTNNYDRYKLLTNKNPAHWAEIKSELDDKATTLLYWHKTLKNLFDSFFDYIEAMKILYSELKLSDLSMTAFNHHNNANRLSMVKNCKMECLRQDDEVEKIKYKF